MDQILSWLIGCEICLIIFIEITKNELRQIDEVVEKLEDDSE